MESKLIEVGGKVWEKDSVKRVYFSKDQFIEFARKNGIDVDFVGGVHQAVNRISTTDNQCKAFFNCVTQKFESKKPTIQAYFDAYANK
jgi:hypothetical protein